MIRLYKNNAYQWYQQDKVYTIGYDFYQDKLYEDIELANLINNLKENIENKMPEMSGYFGIVIEKNEEIILISDIIRSFPIFYNQKGDITDDIELLKGKLNELSIQELLHTRWISCDETIYQDVKQIENAQIVKIKKGNIEKQRYFEYQYCHSQNYSFEELDHIFQNMTKRMIQYLNGRTAVVPLSGGYDSRLIAYYLKQNHYEKIITYTYGKKNGAEVVVSQKVAEFLGLPWYFIEYTPKNCRKKYNTDQNFSEIAQYLARGYSIPHIQEWEAVDNLLKKNRIDNNCVIIPGFTLDFLAGSHLYSEYIENEKLSTNMINEKIYDNNYNLIKSNHHIFDQKLEDKFQIHFGEEKISASKVAEFQEKYDFEERQAKFITNAVRIYDYYGLKWYLPFWDKEVIKFWNRLPLQERHQRKFFKAFVVYKYKDLMDYAPIYQKKESKKIKGLFKKIYSIFYIYYHNPLNFYYYFKLKEYLKYVMKERNFSYDYYIANDYIRYLRRNN